MYAAIQDLDRLFVKRVFLQYYLFYYYDHTNPGFTQAECARRGIPLCHPHEADWELIQLDFKADDVHDILNNKISPIKISLSQHSWSDDSDYDDIPTVDGHSIAYVSYGKHANYFGPDPDPRDGNLLDVSRNPSDDYPWSLSIVQDEISDRGKELLPPALSDDYAFPCPDDAGDFHACTYTYELEVIDEESTHWVAYEGTWGDSKIDGPDNPIRWKTPDIWANLGNISDKSGAERDRAIQNAAFYHWASFGEWHEAINPQDGTARVTQLDFSHRRTIPPSLGDLSHVEVLNLSGDSLVGDVPRQLGYLANLEELHLNDNLLTGELPHSLTKLENLEKLYFQNNAGLCAPTDDEFQDWLNGLDDKEGPDCP